ncbi:LemA family protein [Candidatus Berkelbacteria bacterium]|nr:LemA family protein [Candidatus Berkelbacteria bacterium]
MTLIWILVGLVVLVILWVIGAYNGLVTLKNRVGEAWSDIDVQLKRRYDLIPNLIETVKGYATHEKQLFTEVTKARTAAMKAGSLEDKATKENLLTEALKSVFAVAENYPDLKASQNFLHLQGELTDTEDKIQAARRFYNANVRDFNTQLEVFPTNLIGTQLGFKAREFFAASETEKAAVTVDFGAK